MTSDQRAARLLRWYPPVWRDRYGEEFAQLLAAEIDERPTDWRRTFDVAASGVLARFTARGLRPGAVQSPALAMTTVVAMISAFAAAGLSLWSQLRVATNSAMSTSAATSGTVLLSLGGGALAVLIVLALAPLLPSIGRSLRRDRRLLMPLGGMTAALAVLAIGGHHFATQRDLVGGGASFGRAMTLSISTYWAHPATWLSQSIAVQLWMIASPICFAIVVMSSARLVRRLEMSPAVRRYEARLAVTAAILMLPVTSAAGWWVIGSQSDPGSVLQAGSLDVVLIAAMAAAASATLVAGRRIRSC